MRHNSQLASRARTHTHMQPHTSDSDDVPIHYSFYFTSQTRYASRGFCFHFVAYSNRDVSWAHTHATDALDRNAIQKQHFPVLDFDVENLFSIASQFVISDLLLILLRHTNAPQPLRVVFILPFVFGVCTRLNFPNKVKVSFLRSACNFLLVCVCCLLRIAKKETNYPFAHTPRHTPGPTFT